MHLQDTTKPLAHRSNTDAPGHWDARLSALNALRDKMIASGYSPVGAADYAIAHLDAELEAEAAAAAAQVAAKRAAARARARAKAEYHLAGGLEIRTARDGAYLVPSGSRGGVIHQVRDGVCSCEAGSAARPCWHVEAVELDAARRATVATKAARITQLITARRAALAA